MGKKETHLFTKIWIIYTFINWVCNNQMCFLMLLQNNRRKKVLVMQNAHVKVSIGKYFQLNAKLFHYSSPFPAGNSQSSCRPNPSRLKNDQVIGDTETNMSS